MAGPFATREWPLRLYGLGSADLTPFSSCGLYFKLHGSPRPISGSSDVIRRRSRYGSRPQQQQQTPSASPPSVRIAPAVSIPRAVSKTAGSKADRPTKRRKLGEMDTSVISQPCY